MMEEKKVRKTGILATEGNLLVRQLDKNIKTLEIDFDEVISKISRRMKKVFYSLFMTHFFSSSKIRRWLYRRSIKKASMTSAKRSKTPRLRLFKWSKTAKNFKITSNLWKFSPKKCWISFIILLFPLEATSAPSAKTNSTKRNLFSNSDFSEFSFFRKL